MTLAHYLLQVNIYLIIFYCFYKLLLDLETYFVLNRIYLLSAGILSLAIPFMRFEWFGKQEVAKPIYVGFDQLNDFVGQMSIVEDTTTKFSWGNLIVVIYLLGIVFCALRLVYQLLAVKKLFNNVSGGMAFSFFRKKLISSNVPELATVHLHEDVHIKQMHSADVLFFELLGIFTWINPVIYLYKKTVKNIHEFLADEAAAKFQGDKEAYSLLLLSQAFGVRSNTLTNGFFTKSLIKKRIWMLHKQRSKKTAILKYGLFVPLFALTLVLSSATIRKNEGILQIAGKIPLDNVKLVVSEAIEAPLSVVNLEPKPHDTVFLKPSQLVEIVPATTMTIDRQGASSFNKFYNYLATKISYPTAALEKRTQGSSIVNFTVKNGRIIDAVAQTEVGEGCDEEVITEILAYDDYFPTDGNFSLKVTFKLNGVEGEMKNEQSVSGSGATVLQGIYITANPVTKEVPTDQTVYSFVSIERPPTYPGGIEQFYKFLGANMKYPAAAIDNEIQGNVHLSFTVEKDGSLSDIRVERKLGFGTDEEALRVVKLAKKWNPGVQNGRAVRVRYNIPVKFSLDLGGGAKRSNAIASIRSKSYTPTDEPMVIIDDEINTHSYLRSLDPKTIKSIDVLTSATAVPLYGKAAENGALIIKSKDYKPRVITGTFNNKTN